MSRNLLVVEDIKFINQRLCKIAEQHDYVVFSATNLADAQELVKQTDFSVALVDYRLPDSKEGGIIDCTTGKNIPTIAITPKVTEKVRSHLLNAKVVDYFQKDSVLTFDHIDKILTRLERNPEYTVLVVDDSSTARMNVCNLLRRHQYNVVQAENGLEALKQLKLHPHIKIVITDHEMPEMGGIELVKQIRTKHSREELTILGVSANANSPMSAKFIKYGANDFIAKPFCDEEFYCRLSQNVDFLELVQKEKQNAYTDFMTGLFNRRYLYTEIKKDPNYKKKIFNLAIIDIDLFKSINDTFGHDYGDKALIHLSKLLLKYFKKDYPTRLGGEEFCVANATDTPQEFVARLEALRAELIEHPFVTDGVDIPYTISVGAISIQNSLDILLSGADKRLYKAKQGGRNQVVSK